jgi:hypothetical protein
MSGTTMSGSASGKRRTGLMLAGVALAFFAAIVLKYWLAR